MAVEFGLIIGPFLAIIMVILEAAYLFIVREAIDNALSSAARQILTGQAQSSTGSTAINSQSSFINYALCPSVQALVDCSKLQVNVQQYTTFGSVNLGAPVSGGQLNTTSWGYNACQSGNIMKVEVAYPVAALSAFFTYTNTVVVNGTSSRVLYSTVVFRCEPF